MKGKKDGKNELQSCSEWEDTHWYPINYSSGKMERSKGEIDNRCLIAMLSSPSESKHPWDSFMQHDSAYQHKHTLRSHHIFHWQSSSSHTHPRTHTSAWLSVDKNSPRIWKNDFFSLSVNLPITSTINHLILTMSECREKIQSTKRYLEMAGFVWQPV